MSEVHASGRDGERHHPRHQRQHHLPSEGGVSPLSSDVYFRLIDSCITQFKAQGPYRTCNESKEEEEEEEEEEEGFYVRRPHENNETPPEANDAGVELKILLLCSIENSPSPLLNSTLVAESTFVELSSFGGCGVAFGFRVLVSVRTVSGRARLGREHTSFM